MSHAQYAICKESLTRILRAGPLTAQTTCAGYSEEPLDIIVPRNTCLLACAQSCARVLLIHSLEQVQPSLETVCHPSVSWLYLKLIDTQMLDLDGFNRRLTELSFMDQLGEVQLKTPGDLNYR